MFAMPMVVLYNIVILYRNIEASPAGAHLPYINLTEMETTDESTIL